MFYDYHLGTGRARPFIGESLGYLYDEDTDDSFIAGPEIGVKYYALEKTFIYAKLSYEFLFEDADQFSDRYDEGAVFYGSVLALFTERFPSRTAVEPTLALAKAGFEDAKATWIDICITPQKAGMLL